MFTLTFAVASFAVCVNPALKDYQNIADQTLREYGVADFTKYQLFAAPDMTLEEYHDYIERIAAANAYGLALLSSASESPARTLSPRVIFIRNTYNESKLFNIYFRIYATYDVVTPDGTTSTRPWIENPRNIYGAVTAVGNTLGYTFSQYASAYKIENNGSVTCSATGHWKCESGGVIRDMGDIILSGNFGANHL